MVLALPELLWLALLFFSFALTFTSRKFTEALLGGIVHFLESIPAIGPTLASPFRAAEQAIVSALGSAEHAIDNAIGASFHFLARLTDWLWDELTGHALLILEIATGIYPLIVAYRILRDALRGLHLFGRVTYVRVKRLEREYHNIRTQLRTLEQEYHGIDQLAVRHRLGTLEREIGAIQGQTIPAIQQAENDAASAINNLYEWAKGKASLIGVGTFAIAVTVALDSLGLGNLRCPAFLRVLGRPNCGLGNALESMLGWFVDLFIITDLCEVIPLLETAYSDVAAPAVALLTDAIDATPCVAGNQPPALAVPRLYLPANPSLALSLP